MFIGAFWRAQVFFGRGFAGARRQWEKDRWMLGGVGGEEVVERDERVVMGGMCVCICVCV